MTHDDQSSGCYSSGGQSNQSKSRGSSGYSNAAQNIMESALNKIFTHSDVSVFLASPIFSPVRRGPTWQFNATPSNLTDGFAYQAFCQLGCLIVPSKHPPAFCLLPPTRRPPEVGAHRPPPVCKSSAVRAGCRLPQHDHDFTFLPEAISTSLFSHLAETPLSK